MRSSCSTATHFAWLFIGVHRRHLRTVSRVPGQAVGVQQQPHGMHVFLEVLPVFVIVRLGSGSWHRPQCIPPLPSCADKTPSHITQLSGHCPSPIPGQSASPAPPGLLQVTFPVSFASRAIPTREKMKKSGPACNFFPSRPDHIRKRASSGLDHCAVRRRRTRIAAVRPDTLDAGQIPRLAVLSFMTPRRTHNHGLRSPDPSQPP